MMAKKNTKISGQLLNTNNQPLGGFRVEAWDKDVLIDDFVGEAITDKNGNFEIIFEKNRFRELFIDNKSDIYFKIYANDKIIHNTEDSVLWNIDRDQSNLEIIIDRLTENIPEEPTNKGLKVYGVLRDEFGVLMSDVTVEVLDRDLRNEELLGSDSPKNGKYEVYYNARQFQRREKGAADIVVKILDKYGKEVYKSGIFYNAPDSLEVNINLNNEEYRGESEWEALTKILNPLIEGLSPLELREDELFQDISFLAGESEKANPLLLSGLFVIILLKKRRKKKYPYKPLFFMDF